MRAGCFAEPRVIQLLNRRFVSFFYNTDAGVPQPQFKGKDPQAKAFLKDKTQNKWAFYAAFTAGGDPVGVTDVYANKDVVFDFLLELLRLNPEFDRNTPAEEAILAKAKSEPGNAAAQLAAGQLLEELGKYQQARTHQQRVLELAKEPAQITEAYRSLLRIARYDRDWKTLEQLCSAVEKHPLVAKLDLGADLAAERGYQLKAAKQYEAMRKLMETAIKQYPQSKRMSELRFSAGVACYFLEEKPWAYYHWCWVVENLPDDHLARRCFLAAAHEGMPYKNPELDGYFAPLHGGQTQVIQGAYNVAKETYKELKGKF
ncbi:MAG: hypothetical protein QM703_18565 [Gemmatales bacterium]